MLVNLSKTNLWSLKNLPVLFILKLLSTLSGYLSVKELQKWNQLTLVSVESRLPSIEFTSKLQVCIHWLFNTSCSVEFVSLVPP